jgi:hypothetical protein
VRAPFAAAAGFAGAAAIGLAGGGAVLEPAGIALWQNPGALTSIVTKAAIVILRIGTFLEYAA